MNLTSEFVHQLGGVAFIAMVLLSVAHILRGGTRPWPEALLAVLLVAYGLESFVDVAIHGDAVPENYRQETFQHLIQGGILLAAGVIDLGRLGGVLRATLWRAAMPVGLFAFGGIFLWHAQSGMDPQAMVLMTTQHRAFGLSLWVAALARALSDFALPGDRTARLSWVAPLAVFGLLLLTYSESGAMEM